MDNKVLRDRLKEAKEIGTRATTVEIIDGLKRPDFLVADVENTISSETGLRLFGVLKLTDPALVDPGVTAQLNCLLDDVVVGKQPMVGEPPRVCRMLFGLSHAAMSGCSSIA